MRRPRFPPQSWEPVSSLNLKITNIKKEKTMKTTAAVILALTAALISGCGTATSSIKDIQNKSADIGAYTISIGSEKTSLKINPKLIIDERVQPKDLKLISNLRKNGEDGTYTYGGSVASLYDADNQIFSTFVPVCYTMKTKIVNAMPKNKIRRTKNGIEAPNGNIYAVDGYMYGVHYIYDAKTGLLTTDNGIHKGTYNVSHLKTATNFIHDGEALIATPDLAKQSGGILGVGDKIWENTGNMIFTDPRACKLASEFNANSSSSINEKSEIQNLYKINVLAVSPGNQQIINSFLQSSLSKSSAENFSQFKDNILPILASEAISQGKSKNLDNKLTAALENQNEGEVISSQLWTELDAQIEQNTKVNLPNIPVLTYKSAAFLAEKIGGKNVGNTVQMNGLSMLSAMYRFPLYLRSDVIKNAISNSIDGGK